MYNYNKTIAIDARTLAYKGSRQRGIGHYTISHLEALSEERPDLRFLLLFEEPRAPEGLETLLARGNVRVDAFENAPGDCLYHVPDPMSLMLGFDCPFRAAPVAPATVLFHDLIPLVFKKQFFDSWDEGARQAYMKRLQRLRDSGCLVLANSNFTASELVRLAGIPESRVAVVGAGLNASISPLEDPETLASVRRKYGLHKPFFLVVGSVEYHKRFDLTLEAFVRIKAGHDCALVVAGSLEDPYKLFYRDFVAEKKIPDVHFTGFVPREDLEALYASAAAMVFPSDYEGFGFPVLEAMARGCAVISARSSSIPEIAGDAALLIEPGDPEDLRSRMEALLINPRLGRTLGSLGVERAKLFTWHEAARRTLEAWEATDRKPIPEARSCHA